MRFLAKLFAAMLLAPLSIHAAAQDKPIVAIYPIDDLAQTGQSSTFSAMLETAIGSTGKFRVMERTRLDTLLGEQGKAKSGVVSTNTPGRIGGFEGVDYLVYGAITGLSIQRKADLGAALLGGMLGNGQATSNCSTGEVTLGVDIRITDANTGEVRYVTRINEKQKAGTACGQMSAQIDATGLLRAAADNIASGLVTAIFPIQVASIQPDGLLILNYGQGALNVGQLYTVFEKGEVIVDPATGDVIASNEHELGLVEITDVQARFSKARPVGAFASAPRVGAIARIANAEELKRARKRR